MLRTYRCEDGGLKGSRVWEVALPPLVELEAWEEVQGLDQGEGRVHQPGHDPDNQDGDEENHVEHIELDGACQRPGSVSGHVTQAEHSIYASSKQGKKRDE